MEDKSKEIRNKLQNWDGHSASGEAAYDAMFELEKQEAASGGHECECGNPKWHEEEYCEGDHCMFH